MKYILLSSLLILIFLVGLFFFKKNYSSHNYNFILSIKDIDNQINKTKLKILDLIEKIKSESSTSFNNTFKKLDEIYFISSKFSSRLDLVTLVSKDSELKEEAKKISVEYSSWLKNLLFLDASIYLKLKKVYEIEKDTLNEIEKKFADDVLLDYKISGAELADDIKKKLSDLSENIEKKSIEFSSNIYEHNEKVLLSEEETLGLNESFKNTLSKNDEGLYIIGLDYPTYNTCIQYLESKDARKKIFLAFNTIGYPKNVSVLEEIRKLRHEYALILGFNNYAELDFSQKMSKTYEVVESFCNKLIDLTTEYAVKEKEDLFSKKPDNIIINPEKNAFDPEDAAYIGKYIKEKYYSIDEEEVSKYFPVTETINSLIDIYSNFFNITFKKGFETIWEKDLYVLKAYDEKNNFLGTIILDLFPREGKYNHACNFTMTNTIKNEYAEDFITLIIANFTKPTADKPGLLKFNEVNTFFHEFGHAMHALLGKTTFSYHSGTNVYRDFVEVPSQMFEEWLNDEHILKKISSHYQTKESLPTEMINNLKRLDKFCKGLFVQRQIGLSLLALHTFDEKLKDIKEIKDMIKDRIIRSSYQLDDDHFECSFGHLMGYGASYYSYMWSLVYALDLFKKIKEQGLENPVVGQKLKECILSRGGEKNPLELMKDFLQRDVSFDSFKDYLS